MNQHSNLYFANNQIVSEANQQLQSDRSKLNNGLAGIDVQSIYQSHLNRVSANGFNIVQATQDAILINQNIQNTKNDIDRGINNLIQLYRNLLDNLTAREYNKVFTIQRFNDCPSDTVAVSQTGNGN